MFLFHSNINVTLSTILVLCESDVCKLCIDTKCTFIQLTVLLFLYYTCIYTYFIYTLVYIYFIYTYFIYTFVYTLFIYALP